MAHRRKTLRKRVIGQEAGNITSHGQQKAISEILFYSEYGPKGIVRKGAGCIDDIYSLQNKGTISWLDVRSTGQLELLKTLGEKLKIHPLVLEDIQDLTMRSKFEDYGDYLFFSLQAYEEKNNELISKQISLILGSNYVVSFQEDDDLFKQFRKRFDQKESRLYRMSSDYLLYSLLDIIVDQFFIVVENVSDRAQKLNDSLVARFDDQLIKSIHELAQDIAFIRKELLPINDIALKLRKYESNLLSNRIVPFFEDLYDHTLQNLESLSYQRENCANLMNLYYSLSNARMNVIMKTLTVVSTVFIPLTFLAGVYGMNFEFMPELKWRFGYPLVMALMAASAFVIIRILKKKKWM